MGFAIAKHGTFLPADLALAVSGSAQLPFPLPLDGQVSKFVLDGDAAHFLNFTERSKIPL